MKFLHKTKNDHWNTLATTSSSSSSSSWLQYCFSSWNGASYKVEETGNGQERKKSKIKQNYTSVYIHTYIYKNLQLAMMSFYNKTKLTFNHANKHLHNPSKIRTVSFSLRSAQWGFRAPIHARIVQREKSSNVEFPQGFKELTKTRETCLIHKALR